MYIYLSSMNPRNSGCAYALGGLCASVRISHLITLSISTSNNEGEHNSHPGQRNSIPPSKLVSLS